ncbi:CoA-binding protein [Balneola sp. MJW-20]|uniref:CoA-binding protein n=1 Tax=Gracilimonas aurantiaca TaxID=3234185 RepID=UPI003465ADC1
MTEEEHQIKEILLRSKIIAVVGCSPDKYRTSNYIAQFLMKKGYRIIPVNPNAREILGERCYDSLQDIPEHITIDIVNIFRNKKYAAETVKDVIERNHMQEKESAVWTQLDVSSPEAELLAEQNHIIYIRNKCIMVEWERLIL